MMGTLICTIISTGMIFGVLVLLILQSQLSCVAPCHMSLPCDVRRSISTSISSIISTLISNIISTGMIFGILILLILQSQLSCTAPLRHASCFPDLSSLTFFFVFFVVWGG